MDFYISMGAGRKTKTLPLKEKPEDKWTVNCSVSARNLRKADLGAVIFGCKHYTIKECQLKQLFGLPPAHFSYVKNVTPGLTLFLFNYSDRKLHGIFEAASTGQLNINPYGWTDEGTDHTPYPAQVQVRVRKQCRPLLEEEFAPIIADNYYESMHFWFELDRTQTSKLTDLFLSSAPRPPRNALRSQNTAKWSTLFNGLPSSDAREVDNGVRAPISEETAYNSQVRTECNSWESTVVDPKLESERSYASVLSSKSTTLEQKPWISLFKPSAASSGLHKKESFPAQSSKTLPPSDNSNMEWELSSVSSSLHREYQHLETCSNDWGSEGYEEPLDLKPSSMDSNLLSKVTDSITLSTSNISLATVGLREEIGHMKSIASGLHLHKPDEPDAEWESCVPRVLIRDGTALKTSIANDAKGMHNYSVDPVKIHGQDPDQLFLTGGEYPGEGEASVACTELKSCDVPSAVTQLMREIEELKGSHLKQNLKINSLEQELVQSRIEIQQLRSQCKMLASSSTSYSRGHLEGVDTEASKPFQGFDNSLLIVGGYNGSSWISDLSLYSPTHDIVKSLSPMTFMRSYASAAQLNGELYLVGGVHGNHWYDTVESYNLKHNQWAKRPSLNQRKGSLAGVSVLEKLFAIGGGNGVECYSEVEMFDANIGKWIFTQPMQQKRFAPAVADINGAVYVVGGYDGAQYLKSLERFDPREPKWTLLSSMSTKRGCHSAVALDEKLYAFGGYNGEKMVSTVEVFDPRVCSWMMREPMKHARGYFGAVVIGGKIYAIGGLKDKEEILDTIELFEEGYGWQVMKLKALGKRCFISALVL
ncbi:unnamed protein product [Coffea canephora]|uniref:DCD domain-containing protein n=1 Tax=Coffea canephora TaxID=49390 RepID=A0A068V231_COFCA|nr:unnamed protein product [Coffea canephora]